MIRALVEDAVAHGARRRQACAVLGVSARMVERWGGQEREGQGADQRRGPTTPPANKLSPAERDRILRALTSPRFCDLSPHQIVPLWADEGKYLASEATLYRILREEALNAHRGRAKAPVRRAPTPHVATGPNQVWSWDITYLRSPVAGVFYYLYLILDVWSRKIVGWEVNEVESAVRAADLFEWTCGREGIDPTGIVLHADNGGPMKGATMVVTLERLGVLASFSRPGVSNDNPFSESLFRTLKYRPEYPHGPFAHREAARAWVEAFVRWYNTEHLHSALAFVTPEDRHRGRDTAILARRRMVYTQAREAHPERWAGHTRGWTPVDAVALNPPKQESTRAAASEAAA